MVTDAQVEASYQAYWNVRAQSGPGTGPIEAMRAALEAAEALEPRKVYVTADYYEYQGFGEPGGAYSTREGAEAYLDRNRAYLNDPEVFELELDA